jgi:hypothetical protein
MNQISKKYIVTNTRILLYYALVLFVAGIIKNEVLLSTLSKSIVSIARVISHITLAFSVLTSLIALVTVYVIPILIINFRELKLNLESYFAPLDTIIHTLIINELIKLFFLIFFFWDRLIENKNIAIEYKNSSAYFFNQNLDIFFSLVCVLYWILVLRKKETLSTKNTLYYLFVMLISISLLFFISYI